MRAAAVVANLVQMVLILTIFIGHGISLGGWTILALFFLLLIAFINLVVLLFHSPDSPVLIASEKKGITKRQDFRVTYLTNNQPVLAVGHQHYSVLDLAESGLRLSIGRHERLKKRIRGHMTLLCGESLDIQATLMRREGNEAAVVFKQTIDYHTLLKEKQLAQNEKQSVSA